MPAAGGLICNFDFVLRNLKAYRVAGEAAFSHPHRAGLAYVSLVVYPCKTKAWAATYTEGALSLFVRIVPDVLWADEWSIPDVSYSVAARNHHEGKRDHMLEGSFCFSGEQQDRGWHDFLVGDWERLKSEGWLDEDGAMLFNCSLKGPLDMGQPLRPGLDRSSRMWADRRFTDVSLSVEGGRTVACHLAVLASASPVLQGMLTSRLLEGCERHIVLRDGLSPEDLETFVAFIYTGRLPDMGNFPMLLRLADMYEVEELAQACVQRMITWMTSSNAEQTVQLVSRHSHCLGAASVDEVLHAARKLAPLLFMDDS